MKKMFKRVGAFALIAAILISTGCAKKEEKKVEEKVDTSKYVGTYVLEYSKFVGDPETSKDTSDIYVLTLNEDGTGVQERNGYEFNVTWKVKKDEIIIEEKFAALVNEYKGTLEDGILDVFNGDPDDDLTCEFVYKKK